jgi:hypothetical protein
LLAKRIIDHLVRGTLLEAIKENLNKEQDMQKIQQQIELASKSPGSLAARDIAGVIKNALNKKSEKYMGLPIDYINCLAQLLYERNALQDCSASNTADIMAQTEGLKPEILPPARWNDLSHLLIANGFLRVSEITRIKAVKSAYLQVAENDKSATCLAIGLKAALDQGDLSLVEQFLSRAPGLNFEKSLLESFWFLYYVFKGQTGNKNALAQKYYSENDRVYADYLQGKSVAIVGPAPTGENSATEIDSYDIVIRLNYRGRENMPESGEFGEKIDVSYYNDDNAVFIESLKHQAFMDDLLFSVFKSSKYKFQEKLIIKGKGRLLFGSDKLYFSGLAGMIQLVVHDLMYFQPLQVKLFNVNFFLSKSPYHRNYTSFGIDKKNIKKNWHIFASHNPISQLNYTRNIWSAGHITVDHTCEKVLRMKTDEYMSELEEIYGWLKHQRN